jgi:hypothetical protein
MALLATLPAEVTPPKQKITQLLIAAIEYFTTIQSETAGVIGTAHTFSGTDGFYEIPMNPRDQGQLKFETSGEYPITKETTTVMANIVGLSVDQILMVQAMKGKTLMAMVKDGNCGASGFRWQVGCKCYPATLTKAEYDTESLTLKLEISSNCLPIKYTSTITLAT